MKLLCFEISLYLYGFVQVQTDAVWAVPLLQYGRNVARY